MRAATKAAIMPDAQLCIAGALLREPGMTTFN
jgi:hypothetical protein